ncbi:MAG: hypothetical protein AABY91_09355 [Gemmatimonadota bacterium]
MTRTRLLLLVGCWLPSQLAAQDDCYPGAASHEAKVFAMKSVALAYSVGEAPGSRGARLGLELSTVPKVDDVTATPTICRPGKGPEHANLLAVLVRPRIAVDLPGRVQLDASWLPPVRVDGVKANLFGFALQRPTALGSILTGTVRAHATVGSIEAPITCPDEALADPGSECYQGTRSDDRYRPNIFGMEGILSAALAAGKFRPYLGVGYSHLAPRFQVNFTNRQGSHDGRRVLVDLTRGTVFGGATWVAAARWTLSGEVYATPADAVTGRLVGRVLLGQ